MQKLASKKILAVVGMAGSGKSAAINFLHKKYGWPKIYFGKYTFERIQKDGLATNYENEKIAREQIRAELGMGAFAELSLAEIKKLLKIHDVILIESLYSWAEYKILQQAYPKIFKVLAIYASPATRFERLKHRPIRPIKTLKEFIARDWSEIEGTDKGGPIAIADFTIYNNTSSLSKLYNQLNQIIK